MPSTLEIVRNIEQMTPNGVPVAIEIANRVGFALPVIPKVDCFDIDTGLTNFNNSLIVSALPTALDRHGRSSDCTVIEFNSVSENEIVKTPLSLWMKQILDSAGVKLSDSAQKLMIGNAGAIFRHRIDTVYSRLEVNNG